MHYFEIFGHDGRLLGVEAVPEEELDVFLSVDFVTVSYRHLCFIPGEALVDMDCD